MIILQYVNNYDLSLTFRQNMFSFGSSLGLAIWTDRLMLASGRSVDDLMPNLDLVPCNTWII
jgi:hypothetical protein